MKPDILHLVEAAVYVEDLEAAETFYREVLGLELVGKEPGRHVFFRAGPSMLLVFNADQTLRGTTLPSHGARGPGHFALGIAEDTISQWRGHLEEHGIRIEKEMHWPSGGQSLYFRDPAGNSVELITPGCWGLPSGW